MATMGVRVKQPTGGVSIDASIGADLAKAMFGDYEAELKMAKARSDLALDEWQAKQLKSAIEYNNARTADQQWRLKSAQEAVEPGANIIVGGNQPQPAAPAPVDLGLPETTLAIPMPRPDLAPAPVEEEPEEYGPPIPPELSAAPVDLPDEATAAPVPRPIIASGGDYELGGPEEPAAIEDVPELLPDEEDISVQPVPVTEAVTAEEVVPQAEVPTGGERTPMPVSATGDTIQIDQGPTGDTAVVTTPAGNVRVMSMEDARKLAAGVIANGGDISGGLAKLAGVAGIQSSPTLSPDVKAATLFSGNVPSRESILGTDEAIRKDLATKNAKDQIITIDNVAYTVVQGPNGPTLVPTPGGPTPKPVNVFGETEGGNRNQIITQTNLKIDQNIPLTPQEVIEYNAAYSDEYGPKLVTTKNNDGTISRSVERPEPPKQFRTPDQVIAAAGGGAPKPQVVEPPVVAETPETQPPAAPAPGEPQVEPQALQPDQTQPKPPYKSYGGYTPEGQAPPVRTEQQKLDGYTVDTTTTGEPQVGNESADMIKTYETQFEGVRAAAELDKFLPGDEPGLFQDILRRMGEDDTIDAAFIQSIQDPKTRQFARAAQGFINSFLRRDSGAAIGVKEFNRYYQRFIQPVNQTAQDYIDTRMNRLTAMKGARYSMNRAVHGDKLKMLDQEYHKYGLDLDWAPPGMVAREPGPDDMPPPAATPVEEGVVKQGDTYFFGGTGGQ